MGVKLTGKLQKGITGTDLVLAMTEFLRDAGVVSTYIEFFGDGARQLTVGDRASISNMTPEYGATAAMFYIDEQTIDYLRLTGRSEEQIKLVEQYAKQTGLWADGMVKAEYARVLSLICHQSVVIWQARRVHMRVYLPMIWWPKASLTRPIKNSLNQKMV